MKKLYTLIIAGCVVGLLVPAAFAGKGKKDKAPQTQTVPSDTYAKYDKNFNSALDTDEKAALRKDFAADKSGPLKTFDTDNDGKLSDDEIAAIPATKLVAAPAKEKKNKKKNK